MKSYSVVLCCFLGLGLVGGIQSETVGIDQKCLETTEKFKTIQCFNELSILSMEYDQVGSSLRGLISFDLPFFCIFSFRCLVLFFPAL
jgi:hypothetical protein